MENKFEKYVQMENLLNQLFRGFDFCIEHCVKSGNNIGCCKMDYFDDFYEELNNIRVQKYGKAKQCADKCGYHTNTGCILKIYKSPICLGYICTPYEKYFKSLGIDWNGNEVIKIMGELLNGNNKNYNYLEDKINGFIKIKNKEIK